MDRTDSNKVLTHIDEAKNWLDEAKEEYTQSNRVRGEINLNLAQAEVKYAWELSRRQNVTQNGQAVPTRRVVNYFPAAAAVFIVLGLTGGLYWVIQNAKTGTPALTAENNKIPVKETQSYPTVNQTTSKANSTVNTAPEKSNNGVLSVDRGNQPQSIPISDPQTVSAKPVSKIVKLQETNKIRTLETPEGTKTFTPAVAVEKPEKSQMADNNNKIAASENRTGASVANLGHVVQDGRDFAPNVSKLSVVSLVIDEEALTKEASYSLKNGK